MLQLLRVIARVTANEKSKAAAWLQQSKVGRRQS